METSWYFAYGSNLSIHQMMMRIGTSSHVERGSKIARLANHRLIFQKIGTAEPPFANIISPGTGVLGVIYRCSSADLETLDRYESGYERKSVIVTDPDGEELAAIAYVIRPALAGNTGKPLAAYLERIVSGAKQHGLPEEYVNNIVGMRQSEDPPTNST
jgi:gamma-glutamylcyclotransferase